MNQYHKSIVCMITACIIAVTLIISITTFFMSLKEHDLQTAILKSQELPQIVIENEVP